MHELGIALAAAGGFSAHMERRDMDVHVLTVANDDSTALRPTESHLEGALDASEGHVSARNQNVGALCAALEELLRRPVLDETGLAGLFDWTLTWDPDDLDSLVVALRKDLGLKLERDTHPIEVLAVEPDSTSPDASQVQKAPSQVPG